MNQKIECLSQAGQDIFAYRISGEKKDGTFLDIGANNPCCFGSNTFSLRKNGWTGVCIDIMNDYKENCSNYIVSDITSIDWEKTLELYPILNSVIDYLSFDVDDATELAIGHFPFDKIRFRSLTIEHDSYRVGNGLKDKLRILLKKNGYELLCSDIMVDYGGIKKFEDWWIDMKEVDPLIYEKFRSNSSLGYDVIERIGKNLFLNHTKKQCGVYQYGLRLCNILKKTIGIEYVYKEIDNLTDYITTVSDNYDNVIYNYHTYTMNWLTPDTIQRKIKNVGISHESPNNLFDMNMDIVNIPRPIFEDVDNMLINHITPDDVNSFINYKDDNIPIIGTFGFGFDNKGFDRIVELVNNQYDKAIIKFLIPQGDYVPYHNIDFIKKCELINKKETIKLLFSFTFFSNEDVLKFLSSNTINIFLYDSMKGRGISSVIDYALSVNKPLGISDSDMFRHIYSDEICLYKIPISICIQNSVEYCSKLKIKYSNTNLIEEFNKILNNE